MGGVIGDGWFVIKKVCEAFDLGRQFLLLSQVSRIRKKLMNTYVVDAFEFCRQKETREGKIAVAQLSRLVEDCADDSGEITWSLVGGTHEHGYPQWQLKVGATVQLMCQRCLTPFAFQIAANSTLILARDDEKADEMEVSLDDESIDVIVGSRVFNLLELIEDEALLALPLAPKHAACQESEVPEFAADEKELPFLALKGLKQ